ncbi:MAG: GNAT family N-acetyltransferase [Pseudomonadaceae bacterium]|nr:GNAT family N-acetyltransferase [Pseudomonadaceae bacterium]
MPLAFRRALPDDVAAAVPLIYSSGPAAFDYAFACTAKGDAQDFLRWVFVRGRGQFGYRQHWVGSQDGQVVASGTAQSGEANLANLLLAASQIIRFYGPLQCWKVLWRGVQLERIIAPPPKRTFYLAHLGVSSAITGQGIGSQLIDFLLQQGRAAGFSRCALDVAASNPRAQALYERLGFAVQRETASHLPGIAAHRYLQRAL